MKSCTETQLHDELEDLLEQLDSSSSYDSNAEFYCEHVRPVIDQLDCEQLRKDWRSIFNERLSEIGAFEDAGY